MTFCVGLTGGIGCGKSTVAPLFAEQGVTVIDTDIISHQLTQSNGAANGAIVQAFGADYLNADGALNRAKMRAHIFAQPHAKARLESILHPLIRAQVDAELARVYPDRYAMLVIPLLFSSPTFRARVQRVLLVDCDEEKQVQRVITRSGLNETEVRNIIAQQTSRTERLQLSDDVLPNNGELDELKAHVAVLHQLYLKLAKQNSH